MTIPRFFLRTAAVVVAALSVGAMQLSAQSTTGAIGGRILGSNGEPISTAQVQVINGATGMTVAATSRSDGNYVVIGLEVGDQYRVTVRHIGYAPQTVQPVRVNLGQTTPVTITLATQAAQLAAVTVEAAAQGALISPTQKGSSTSITDTLLRKLPTVDRNFTDFVKLVPQVSTSGPGLSGGGVNNRYNNIQIDGATDKDLFGLGSTGQPGGQAGGKSISLDAVKEYQVLLAPYDVRVGNFAGLSVNAVTKSGTNTFSGTGYDYYRNQNFERTQPYLGRFNESQYGFALGGPIVQDKAFFFINPEFQSRAVPAGGASLGDGTTRVTQAQIDQFTSQLAARGQTNLGGGQRVSNQNPLTNVFARFDFALPGNSTLILRDNYAHAEQQVFSRGATSASASPSFALTSNLYQFTSSANSPVAQLRTNFSNGAYNEAILSYTRIRDARATPGTLQPQVTEILTGTATFVGGTEAASQANQLDQDVQEFTDNFTIPVGANHRFTFGTQNQWYKVRNLFGNNLVGAWTFGTADSLAAGTPRSYSVGVPVSADGAVRFKAGQFAVYAQDDWTATPNLTFSIGIRLDDPIFFDKPPENATVLSTFNRNTSDIPSGNVQYSPRAGFNWNATGDGRNQIRGGAGLFQSAPAYVWLSNSFQNSGGSSGFASLTCTGAKAPLYTAANVAKPPTQCLDGTNATAGSEVDLAGKNLKFPQNLRGNLAYDRDLGDGFVGGVEAIYTRAINALFYTNIALQDSPIGVDLNGRSLYGTTSTNPTLKVPGRFTVLAVQNESKDYSYSYTADIQKRFTKNFGGSLAYTYTQAFDVQSLTSSTASSQFKFGRIYSGNQNELNLSHSAFETPNRIVGDVSYTLPTRTSISVIYTGQSGLNFAYVSSGDLNGDNQSGNDPIYVPTSKSDLKGPVFVPVTIGSTAYTADQEATAFDHFVSSTPCLQNARGTIMQRNTCQTPWTNEFDVSLEQAVGTFRGENISVRMDAFNFGNLLNKRWGPQINTGNFNPVSIYTQTGTVLPGTTTTSGATLLNGVPRATFDPNFNPFNFQNIFSNYTLQLSLRYTF